MNARIVTQITIKASPTEVFKYLSDLRYHYLWNPQIHRIQPITVLTKGAQYDTESLVLGVNITAHNVVTRYVPGKELEFDNRTGTVHYRANFKLTAAQDTTLVVCTTEVSSESRAFAFAKPVLQRLARRELQTDLQALKIAVEQKLEQKGTLA